MSTSPLVRFFTLTVLALVLCTGCARNLKKGSGQSGDIYDTGGTNGDLPTNDTVPLNGSALPPRDESLNLETADFGPLAAQTVYFGFDSFSIAPEERGKLEKTADYIKEHTGTKVVLAGHTDARGTTQYNLALGDRRANAVREYLIGLGVPAGNLIPQSYGEERPADSGSGEAAYAKNRRVQAGILK
jgi:peptidoglycan-associated lipoprotein